MTTPLPTPKTIGNRPHYEHVHASEVPGAVRFDVPPEFVGKAIEVAYGGDPRSDEPHAMGAPFKRVRNTVTKTPATFFRRDGIVKDEEVLWRATQVADGARKKEVADWKARPICIDFADYERNHGAKPRGRGSWMFVFAPTREQLAAKMMSPNLVDHVWTAKDASGIASMKFSDAARLARAEAKRRGAAWAGVCS